MRKRAQTKSFKCQRTHSGRFSGRYAIEALERRVMLTVTIDGTSAEAGAWVQGAGYNDPSGADTHYSQQYEDDESNQASTSASGSYFDEQYQQNEMGNASATSSVGANSSSIQISVKVQGSSATGVLYGAFGASASAGATASFSAPVTVEFIGNYEYNAVGRVEGPGYGYSPGSGTVDETLTYPAGDDYNLGVVGQVSTPFPNSYDALYPGTASASFDESENIRMEDVKLDGSYVVAVPAVAGPADPLPPLQITNAGSMEVNAQENTNYYLSTTPDGTGSPVLLATASYNLDLPAGSSLTESPGPVGASAGLFVPVGTAPGTYYLVAQENFDGSVVGTAASRPIVVTLLTLANLNNVVRSGVGAYTDESGVKWNSIAYKTDPDNAGFAAEAFASSVGSEVVIAIRGTVTSFSAAFFKNWAANVSFAGSVASPALGAEVSDGADFVSGISISKPNLAIALTGHSLGGAVAQLIGKASGFPTEVFNAPGAGQLYAELSNDLAPVVGLGGAQGNSTSTNYRLYGDQVSLFGTPIGKTVTIDSGASFSTRSVLLLDLMANASAFLYVHAISTFITQIKADAPEVSTDGEPNDAQALENWINPSVSGSVTGWITYKFVFSVLNTIAMALDPANGSDYVMTGGAGSPNFASLALPTLPGVASYNLRCESGGVWSAFQTVQPGVQTAFGANVQGIEFQPVDSQGQGVAIGGAFLFAPAFASTGIFTGTLSVATPSNDVVIGTPAVDQFTLAADPDGTDIDWSMGANRGQLPMTDPNGLTIDGIGSNDVIMLDYAHGNPLPNILHLNGTFTINGLHGSDPLANTAVEIGRSTVYISYGSATADPIAAIRGDLQKGYDNGGWNGTPSATSGVITSAAILANSAMKTAIGYADAADGSGGDTVPNTIELKYTSPGDANLDGSVNFADLVALARNYGRSNASWDQGDFNYDGQVGFDDVVTLARNYGHTAAAADTAILPHLADPLALGRRHRRGRLQ